PSSLRILTRKKSLSCPVRTVSSRSTCRYRIMAGAPGASGSSVIESSAGVMDGVASAFKRTEKQPTTVRNDKTVSQSDNARRRSDTAALRNPHLDTRITERGSGKKILRSLLSINRRKAKLLRDYLPAWMNRV